jgi:hypothetical protein
MDFWSVHSVFFIVFMFLFPRLTMFFMCSLTGYAHPILFWVGFFLTPRLLIAILATTFYWETNPVLVTFAWMNAFFVGGASSNETSKQVRKRR